MDIKSRLRAALLTEGAHKDKKYGCVMVYLGFDKADWKTLQDVIDKEDLYEPKDDTGFGKEKEPHVTILFGLHDDIPDSDIMDEVKKLSKPVVKFDKVSSFSNPLFDVLKYDIASDDLHKANKVFAKYPNTTDYPKYHPHCTIAYVKKGTASKYIKKLNDIEHMKITSDKIVYSKADGKKIDHKLD